MLAAAALEPVEDTEGSREPGALAFLAFGVPAFTGAEVGGTEVGAEKGL